MLLAKMVLKKELLLQQEVFLFACPSQELTIPWLEGSRYSGGETGAELMGE